MSTVSPGPTLRRFGDRVQVGVEEIQSFLASEAGRRFRRVLATGLVVGAPLLFKIPGLKRYPLIRALELIGGAALVIKLAESLRDWEPSRPHPVVIDIPGRS
jgi:hypothetical protein